MFRDSKASSRSHHSKSSIGSIDDLPKIPEIEFLLGKDNYDFDNLKLNYRHHHISKFMKDVLQFQNFKKFNIYFIVFSNGHLMIEYENNYRKVSSVFHNTEV